MKKVSKIFELSKEDFLEVVNRNTCVRDIVSDLGFSRASGSMAIKVKERIKLDNIDISHFIITNKGFVLQKYKLDDILIKDSSYSNISRLKIRLVKEGYKKYECEICGNNGEWQGKNLSLQLDHINGIHNDNRLENIRFICPNCHAQTETFSGKNSSNYIKNNDYKNSKHEKINNNKQYKVCIKCGKISNRRKSDICRDCYNDLLKDKYCENCNEKISKKSKTGLCLKCSIINRRKQERPDLETLLKDTKELGFVGTGKKYGVSDNSIRKWIKSYEKDLTSEN